MKTRETTPCQTCPWRRSNPAGGAQIPGFRIALMRGLQNTVGLNDGFRPIMACHHSPCGEERACVGYVAVEGYRNINVRLMAICGEIDLRAIDDAVKDIDLWPSFGEMLDAYELAQPDVEPRGHT